MVKKVQESIIVNIMNNKSYEKLLKRISKNIKKARRDRKLTQEKMSDYGFNYRHYQKIESGSYSMNLYTLHRLSKIFKIKITLFFKE